jgi:hypothetical protein
MALMALMVMGAVLVAGCGSGGDDTATATATPTKAVFIRKADVICRNAREAIINGSIPKLEAVAGTPKAQPVEFELISSLLIPTLEEEVEDLRALGTPAGDETKIEKILQLTEHAIAEAKTEPETYTQGSTYKQGSEHYGKAYQLSLNYGMKECPMR